MSPVLVIAPTEGGGDWFGVAGEGCKSLRLVGQPELQVHYGSAYSHHLNPEPDARRAVPNVAVVVLDAGIGYSPVNN